MDTSRPGPARPNCRPCSILALALAASAPLHAQAARPLTPPPAHTIDQWTTANGLPQNSVNAMVVAPDGHLWLGTFGGLVRFDGTGFTLVARTDSAGRHVDRVLALAVAADSALWIGTENGLLRLKDGAWRHYRPEDGLPGTEIPALLVTRAGTLWVGTARGGIARLSGDRFDSVITSGPPLGRVQMLGEEHDGTVWANIGDHLYAVAGMPLRVRPLPAPVAGAIHLLLEDRAGQRWYSTRTGPARAGGPRIASPEPSVMVEDPHRGLWLGTRNDGVYHVDPGAQPSVQPSVQRYALPDGRRDYRVRSALVDPEGDVWIGTDANGLLRAKRNLFTTYTTANGLSHDVATAVFEDRGGTLWVGTNCGGVNAIDPARRTVRLFNPRRPGDPLGDPCAFALTETPDGMMWQGSYGGGVTRLEGPLAGRRHQLAGPRDTIVRVLFADKDGLLWVGTDRGGVAVFERGRLTATYTTSDGLAHNSIRTIRQTRDGSIWIGTLQGLSHWSGGRFTTYGAADGLSTGHVRALHEDADGTLWIGTYGGGLYRLKDRAFTTINKLNGLADDVVSTILEDDRGNLWMSGNLGIQRVARADLNAFADGRAARVHAVMYGAADGLRNAETNGGFQPSGWKDRNGQLWFPTVQGVTVVDPTRLVTNARAATASIEAVLVNGAVQQADGELVVGPGPANLEFRYTGLSLSAPEHLSFRYRLEEFDRDWVDAGARRVAYYPRLAPGRYRFVVAAANRDGVWNAAGAALPVRVVPTFWNAGWFRLLAAAAFVGLLAIIFRRRAANVRHARAAQEEFSRRLIESQEAERKRIARELHDGLGQELLVVKNRALLALRSATLDAEAGEQLRHINEVVSGSLANVRGLAHNLTPHQLDHLGLSVALRNLVEDVAQAAEVTVDVTIEPIDEYLAKESGINVFRIVQEALANIVRHSGSRSARVHVRRDSEAIRLTIADQGRGFVVPRGHVGGLGLTGIAERVRILGGSVDIVSAPGQGTRIEVSVPAGREVHTS